MSFRSALNSPSISSGSVGVVYQAVTSGTIALDVLDPTTISTIIVPAGVYSINLCANFEITDATYVASGQMLLGSSIPSGSTPTDFLINTFAITSVTAPEVITHQASSSSTLVLSVQTKLYLQLNFNYANGTGINSIVPSGIDVPYSIQAVKLA